MILFTFMMEMRKKDTVLYSHTIIDKASQGKEPQSHSDYPRRRQYVPETPTHPAPQPSPFSAPPFHTLRVRTESPDRPVYPGTDLEVTSCRETRRSSWRLWLWLSRRYCLSAWGTRAEGKGHRGHQKPIVVNKTDKTQQLSSLHRGTFGSIVIME
ncbi:hypothetical protein TMatcc_004410 [Talaromyces marneffei ATCC 18224]